MKNSATEERWGGCDCGGKHYSLGARAWCLDCNEYCSESSWCEVADLRRENAALVARIETLTAALDAFLNATRGLTKGGYSASDPERCVLCAARIEPYGDNSMTIRHAEWCAIEIGIAARGVVS